MYWIWNSWLLDLLVRLDKYQWDDFDNLKTSSDLGKETTSSV